ncbi:acyl-ACP--UDP-N-acetylglucosamine O-acyltransferase [Candidatus Dependentiae bacterium]
MNSIEKNKFENLFFNSTQTYIHPSSIIGSNVTLGQNVKIGPFCTIVGNVKIGNNTKIYSHVSIGSTAQDISTTKPFGSIEIGNHCNIREFVSIGASKKTNGKTSIQNNCYIMSYTHIAHDVILEDNVVLINNVNLGGHTYVEKNAFLMANSATHQFCRIGKFTALTPFSAINQDLPPFCMFHGIKAKFHGLNSVALKRAGIAQESINSIKHVAKLFYQDKLLLDDIKNLIKTNPTVSWAKDQNVNYFLEFIKKSTRGVSKGSEI